MSVCVFHFFEKRESSSGPTLQYRNFLRTQSLLFHCADDAPSLSNNRTQTHTPTVQPDPIWRTLKAPASHRPSSKGSRTIVRRDGQALTDTHTPSVQHGGEIQCSNHGCIHRSYRRLSRRTKRSCRPSAQASHVCECTRRCTQCSSFNGSQCGTSRTSTSLIGSQL